MEFYISEIVCYLLEELYKYRLIFSVTFLDLFNHIPLP